MTTNVRLIVNCDDAVIFWTIAKPITDCWGFAIEKESRTPDGKVARITLDNRKGFERDKPKIGEVRPSTDWPFQRFWWADFTANLGDEVRYRVTPMIHTQGKLRQLINEQSDWTAWIKLSGGTQDGFSSYFNRGLVISQFMSRYLEDLRIKNKLKTRKEALSLFKDSLTQHELPIRNFLSGTLRTEMLALLDSAKKSKGHLYAALYELEDDELIAGLTALKGNAHVVLSNGSITKKKAETSKEARKRDQNKSARKLLKDSGVEVFGRFVSPGALGHNKFLVLTDSKSTAKMAWTGSTNWTTTGLCTQINNGLLIDNPGVAAEYLAQWERLRDAESAFPPALVDANDQPAAFKSGKHSSSGEIWFTRTHKKVDLAALDDVVNSAKEAVMFLMFQPGGTATLATIRALQSARKSLYIKGVVSTPPSDGDSTDESEVTVETFTLNKRASATLDIVRPEGMNKLANWAATVTRNEFLTRQGGVVGYAIVHSKLIVVDPFTNPVVVTGSHNFSGAASGSNDDNFIIVRGNQELALHYATHVLSVYHHYRWLAYVNDLQKKGKQPGGFLLETGDWQKAQLNSDAKRELDFWVR
ncbi:Phosphatidylserine/phosphatidylglycerophosphate/cardiolipin synthase [Burkholderia sp. YR290]|jgi:hypothetical protein|uniref:phospholipase D-like domain-containing protein n=1 Tax=Paraburkholderia hospita TaxID=169430 RepID=UPI0009A5CA84|nr:phospholipase D-like domain-containing protein [Paraburkholderia hospita]SKC99725.1 Phosphatidylserine/phosphatidylglycerophosphate/cardiolipin synthase [Paraburkholderia hospita]SOE91161.1 Phosphatidylserine/phosphatidylglycerophosphate/cardiolipin synthase [Burkholderia sp. YR290]